MDAEKLPEVSSCGFEPGSASPAGPASLTCPPTRCRIRCSLETVDSLLAVQDGSISGEEADYLLDLRQLLKGRTDAERTLRAFCELRRRLEQREYLAFYRLRRWLENQVVCHVRASPDGLPMTVPLRLDNYCIEAVRRVCICAAINTGMRLTKPRLTFTFVPRGELLDSAGVSAGREA